MKKYIIILLCLLGCNDSAQVIPYAGFQALQQYNTIKEAPWVSPDSITVTGGPGVQVMPFRMLGGYRTTWKPINNSLLGFVCDSFRWDSTHHSYYAELKAWYHSDSFRVGLHTLTMKPNPGFSGWLDSVFQAVPATVNGNVVIQAVEGVRSSWGPQKDTLFLYRGVYNFNRWDGMTVNGVDTAVILW